MSTRPPTFRASLFRCETCQADTQHFWTQTPVNFAYTVSDHNTSRQESDIVMCRCVGCQVALIWWEGKLIYPLVTTAPPPHPSMPDDVMADYLEAGSLVALSPRAAAAMLRLSVQKLCVHLGGEGKKIDADIGALVKNGLPVLVQRALDIVRVVGNESVHPGQMDLKDDAETAGKLFDLVNMIVEDRIARPAAIEELYNSLPADKRQWIEDRDKASKP